ncbi:MAG: acetyltransferase [Tateyamaria sp.]|uniref:acetyltransferase n=1 Tax=Tateyamaria sp. TaxID=1929288 RepID=UPI00329EFD08
MIDSFECLSDLEITGILDNQTPSEKRQLPGLREILDDGSIDHMIKSHHVVCVLASTHRRKWIEDLERRGFSFASLIHPSCTISTRTAIGAGCILDVETVIAGFTQIGAHVRIGRGIRLGHHTHVGRYSTLHPGCIISGQVTIGEQVTIGTGSVVTDNVQIGDGAVIAAGSVVTKKVLPGSIVRGVPARLVKQNYGPV